VSVTTIKSQHTFIFSEKDSLTDDYILDATELQNGNLILLGGKEKFGNGTVLSQDILVMKFSSEGELKIKNVLNPEGFPSITNNIVEINPNSLLLAGNIYIDSSQLLFIKTDSSLNVTESKIVSIPGFHITIIKIKIDHNKNLLIYGNITQASTGWPNFPFIYKFSENLDSLGLKIFNYHSFGSVDLLEKSDNSGYYLFTDGDVTLPGNGHIFSLDTSFSVIRIDSIPNQVYNFNNSRWISNSKFILTGFQYNGPPLTDNIGALLLDTSYSVLYGNRFGTVDSSSIPGFQKNLDFNVSNEIYIGGIYLFGAYSDFGSTDSWFYLNHVDTLLNLKWQKYYGGDKNYAMFGLLATKDSGCLMYGATYNWQKYDYQRDVYAIKVNNKGLLLGTDNSLKKVAKEVILYPNPGIDKIVVESGLKNLVVSFFDINGRCILKQQIQSMVESLDVSELVPGIYFYRFTDGEKVVETGKWIKE
jgi:hypothetical protein